VPQMRRAPENEKGVKGLIKVTALACALVVAVVLPVSAGAQGKPSQGCPPSFEEVTLAQALALPRIVAGIEAGAYTEADLTAQFHAIDKNDDGTVCVQETRGSFQANPASGWQFLYNAIDNNASVPG
jgi:hypothetical protein